MGIRPPQLPGRGVEGGRDVGTPTTISHGRGRFVRQLNARNKVLHGRKGKLLRRIEGTGIRLKIKRVEMYSPRTRRRSTSKSGVVQKLVLWAVLGFWAYLLFKLLPRTVVPVPPAEKEICDARFPEAARLARLQIFPFIRERTKTTGLDFQHGYYRMAVSKRLVVVLRRRTMEFGWEGADGHALRCVRGLKQLLKEAAVHLQEIGFDAYPLVFLFNLHSGAGSEVVNPLKPNHVPIFSYCKSRGNERHILFPRYYMNENDAWAETNGTNQNLKQFRLDSFRFPWGIKHSKAIFRGAASASSRVELVKYGNRYPDVLDAAFTSLPPYSKKWDPPNVTVDRMPMKEQVEKFKYIVYAVGAGDQCADRLLFYLTGDSVVLKQDSPFEEWWHTFLVPYTHYFPVSSNWSDLLPLVEHLRHHDQHVQHIPNAARHFMQTNVSWEATKCYAAQVMELYGQLLDVRNDELLWIRELINYEVLQL